MINITRCPEIRNLHTLLVSVIVLVLLATTAFAVDPAPMEPAALNYTGHRELWNMDPNLTGQGTLIGTVCRSLTYINEVPQNDYRFNMRHQSLYDADVVFMDGTEGGFGISDHATAIAGILLGFDPTADYPDEGTFVYHGVCPNASVNAYEFVDFSTQTLLGNRPLTENIFVLSLGEMFEYWWVRGLERAAAEYDVLIVASNGNGRDSITPMPLYPAAGSNVLSVGVVDSVLVSDQETLIYDFSTPKANNSSVGPTEDHRCKPDIVAPGTALVPSGNDNTSYELVANWSSLAAPIVAGTAALLHQKGMTDPALKEAFDSEGKSLVLKAVLMNSARKLAFWHKGQVGSEDDHETPLDYTQGAGVLDTVATYRQLTVGTGKPGLVANTGWDNRLLQGGDWGYEYAFDVNEPNQIIAATLCWNRAYQDRYPFSHRLERDTDLRLELWGIDPNAPQTEILLDYSDSVNDNVEHIYFAADGSYRSFAVRVRFNPNQPADASLTQRFALAWSVGPDRQIGNPWWYDLNADNTVNANDNVIYTLIEAGLINRDEMAPLLQSLGLDDDRLGLLTEGWSSWKLYLTDWKQ